MLEDEEVELLTLLGEADTKITSLVETDIKRRLSEGDVPFQDWGKPHTATRSLADFVQENVEGSARLTSTGPVSCLRITLCVELFGESPEGKRIQLYETAEVHEDGAKRIRNLAYVSESLQMAFQPLLVPGEDLLIGARRGVGEETGMWIDLEHFSIDWKPRWTPFYLSDVYPGLVTRRCEFHCRCNVPKELVNMNGYTSVQRRVTSVFNWGPPLKLDRLY